MATIKANFCFLVFIISQISMKSKISCLVLISLFSFSISPLKSHAAEITAIDNLKLNPGETVITISGSGFGSVAGYVDFGGEKIVSDSDELLTWEDNKIRLRAPEELPGGNIKIGVPKNPDFEILIGSRYEIFPSIESLQPSAVQHREEMTLKGNNFGSEPGQIIVTDIEMKNILKWSEKEIVFVVPDMLPRQTLGIEIITAVGKSETRYFTLIDGSELNTTSKTDDQLEPVIRGISPAEITPGTSIITLEGVEFGDGYKSTKKILYTGFDLDDLRNEIQDSKNSSEGGQISIKSQMKNIPAENIISWTNRKVVFISDLALVEGAICIQIEANIQKKQQYCWSGYKIKPQILEVLFPLGEVAGAPMIIIGSGFGDAKGGVYIGQESAVIIGWTRLFIIAEIPARSGNLLVSTEDNISTQGDKITHLGNITKDEFSRYQWYLRDTGIPDVWKKGYEGKDVVVAILDDGIYVNHPDLGDNLWKNKGEIAGNGIDDDNNGFKDDVNGWNMVDDDNNLIPKGIHGTAVAGIIAAKKNNAGIVGIAPQAKLMPVIISNDEGAAEYVDLAAGIIYAADNGADIINISFGGMGLTTDHTTAIDDALKHAYEKGVVIIVSAGNQDIISDAIGTNLDVTDSSPVCNDIDKERLSILGVTATDRYFSKPNWAAFGRNCVDFAAPGTDILTTTIPQTTAEEDQIILLDGTSFSAPVLSGMAALIKSAHPDWNNLQIAEALWKTSTDINEFNRDQRNKVGRYPNIKAAIDYQIIAQDTSVKNVDTDSDKISDENSNSDEKDDDDQDKPGETKKLLFQDVENTHPYYDAISYVFEKGIVQGYSDGTYKADQAINRAEFMKIIVEARFSGTAQGKNCFPDVKEEWFSKYVCFGSALGIVKGYSDGFFRPGREINFVEALKIVIESFGLKVTKAQDGEPWFQPYLQVASQNGLSLYGKIPDSKNISRAEMAEIIKWISELKL